jgi:hypothetical protein
MRRRAIAPNDYSPNGLHPTLVDDEGVTISLDAQNCGAKQNGMNCCLDRVHKMLGTKHTHRHPDGRLENF